MRRTLLYVLLTLLCGSPATAADIALKPAYPPYQAVSNFDVDWSGFYVGINGGGVWGNSTWAATNSFGTSGALVGLTAGYNYQVDQVIIGVEGDIDAGRVSGSAICAVGCETRSTWLGTARGRVGYAWDRFLPYITGGVAFGDIRANALGFPGGSTTNLGWTVGAGVEYALSDEWSLKAEYLHIDLGKYDCGANCGLAIPGSVSINQNLIRVGISFKFGVPERHPQGTAELAPTPKPGDTDDPGPKIAKKQQNEHTKPTKRDDLTLVTPLPRPREY